MLATIPVGIFQSDRVGRVTAANASFVALVTGGVSSSPTAMNASAPWAHAHPGDRAHAELTWRRGADATTAVDIEFRVWHSSGRYVWVKLQAEPQLDPLGRCYGYAGTAIDHTEAISQRLRLERIDGVLDATRDAVVILDRNGAPIYTNAAARDMFGLEDDLDIVRNPNARGLMQVIRDQVPRDLVASSVTESWAGEVEVRRPDGLPRILHLDLVIKRGPDGVIEYWGGVARDITTEQQLQAELYRQATTDSLTDLPNRSHLLRQLTAAVERLRSTHDSVALLFVDVDNLKQVNDSAGHQAGNELLTQVAQRLEHATRPADIVARYGGDEFVVLCHGSLDAPAALDLAERVRLELSGQLMVQGVEVDLSVSVGVATAVASMLDDASPAEVAEELVANADDAMYAAKQRGRSRSELYTDAMREARREHKRLINELEQALASGQLHLAYQPIISTHSGRMAGAEALLRWEHPDRGTLLPGQFVHLAEESGAILPIGEWVLRQACADARAWLDSELVDRTFSVHVNVSPRQLEESTFVERVLGIVRQYELNPNQLTLDFDEATLHHPEPALQRSLQALRRFGVRLGLDRFGAGAASLTALRTGGADVLKLDGTIARELGANGDDDPVVRAIIQLAHAMDMQVVAEWVNSAEQLHRLRVLGCDLVQGHLLGEPIDAESFARRSRR